jgi:predicted MFS family arabinose efflux permease
LHGWSTALISGASTVTLLIGGVLVIFANDVIEWLGAKALVLLGAFVLALSLFLLAFVTEPLQLYLVYLLMSFAWVGMGSPAITIILSYWFTHRRGLAMSLALNGASFGGILVAPLLIYLIGVAGFGRAMFVAAAVVAAVLVPTAVAWVSRPAHSAPLPDPDGAAAMTRAQALRNPAFLTLAGPFGIGLVAQVGFLVHQIAFLQSSMGLTQAGFAVALTTVMAVVGRVALGAVIDRVDPRRASAVTFLMQTVTLTAMTFTQDATLLLLLCCLFGFAAGNLLTLPQVVLQREFAPASFAMLVALASSIVTLVAAVGPGLIGVVRDATGGYAAGLLLCAALDAIAAVVVLMRPGRGG